MNLARYLDESRVDLDLDAAFADDPEPGYEALVLHMAELLARSDDVVNATKMRTDLVNRERRAPSLLGSGVALPHVRTLQARRLILAVAVSRDGLEIATPDELPVRISIALIGPPYDDKAYLAAYRALGERLQNAERIEDVVRCGEPGEIVRVLARH
jgi:mannitol/fructose-specific phosphotransferase system IIA component (Ntr-type)